MNRSKCILLILVTVGILGASTHAAPRPNILFFLVDDMGWQDTSVPFHVEATRLNRMYRTPSMERLAAEGIKFTQAYASAVCSPTRVSALTGMNAARHRVTNWTLRKGISPDTKHAIVEPPAWNLNGITTQSGVERTMQVTPLPLLLRQEGYRTIHVGKAHFGAKDTPGENPLNLGFDVNIAGHAPGGPGSYHGKHNFSAEWRKGDRIWDVPGLEAYHGKDIFLTEALTLEAVKCIEKAVADHKPFYLYMSHYAVHAPFEKDERFYSKYIQAGLNEHQATYASMLEGMDKSLGDLMDTIKRLGISQNTIILFSSDNGSPQENDRNLPLRGHKLNPYEGGIRVPMIVKWPGVTAPGSTCRSPVIIEDFFPTILEMAGISWRKKVIQKVDGCSLVPYLQNIDAPALDRALVWHFPHTYGQLPFSSIRMGPYKLIHHPLDNRLELFNIDEDISEEKNIAPAQPAKTAELSSKLTMLLKERGALMPVDKRTGKPFPFPSEN